MIISFLKENAVPLLLTLLAPLLFLAVFLLYGLPAGPFLYAALLYSILSLCVWHLCYLRFRRLHTDRAMLREPLLNGDARLPEAPTLADADWQETAGLLCGRIRALTDGYSQEKKDAQDYYTVWVHQIKTPIAAMRMQLQAAEPAGSTGQEARDRALEAELFRIEQYAEMALQYIRLEESGSDLNFREQRLDDIIRGCIRKYAPMFITKKLAVRYEGTGLTVLTDAKWLSFILEQLLSNAVKYTSAGNISITVTDGPCITVADTGIGIAPEDLPRIFEKGFTGRNGRTEGTSTGLGLYLCGLAAEKLDIELHAGNTAGSGAAFTLAFRSRPVVTD